MNTIWSKTFVLLLCSTGFFSAEAKAVAIVVHPEVRHQTIEGFGCSIAAWVPSLSRYYYDDAFTRFVADELGLSVFRLQMWGGVSPVEVKDWHDISYKDFQWTTEGLRGKINVEWAKRLVEANPEVKVIGSVWSPPGWMKKSGRRTGTKGGFLLDPKRDYDRDNHLREDRYRHFAKWIVEWARYMESQGTPFYALSLQNELMFTEPYESALYTPEEYAKVVRITGEMFESEGVRKPLFFGPEDMTLATYADAVRHKPYVDALMQPEVAKYFDVFATHGYSDGVRSDSRNNVVDYWREIARFGRPYWITEGGTGGHEWPAPVVNGIAPRLHVALTVGNVSLFCGWQLTAAPGKASEHDFMEGGQATPKTYAAMQYWRHVRPGAVRVDVDDPGVEDLLVSAFIDDSHGEAVTIIVNQSAEPREVAIDWKGGASENWRAFQTSADESHDRVEVSMESGCAQLGLPGYSITTAVADLTPRAQSE